MKKQLTAISIIGNIALVAGLLWTRADHRGELHDVGIAAMRGDEIHLELHAASLAALESGDPQQVETTVGMLRTIVAAGERNIESRQRMGLAR